MARERREPGALAAEAETRLRGSGNPNEKAGLLRALRAIHPAESVGWFELAARTARDDSDSHGESLVALAIDNLEELARRGGEARLSLRRLASEEGGLACAPRRRAATAFARRAPEEELTGLRPLLADSRDERLVAGVLAVLETRIDSPTAGLLRAEWGRSEWGSATESREALYQR